MTQLIEIEIVKDTTVRRKIADMVDKTETERTAFTRRYAEQVCRLRQAYNLALAGNRVRLTGGYVVTGAGTDLQELDIQVGEAVLVGWLDSGEFHPESSYTSADDFVSQMYWQSFDVENVLPVIRHGVRNVY